MRGVTHLIVGILLDDIGFKSSFPSELRLLAINGISMGNST